MSEPKPNRSLPNSSNSFPNSKQGSIRRREFLAHLSAGTLGISIVPRHVLGGKGFIAPSERVRMAGIGVGGMGGGDVGTLTRLGAEYVALCDVDEQRAAGTFGGHKNARKYKDFREMLEKEFKRLGLVVALACSGDRCSAEAWQTRVLPKAADANAGRVPVCV